jgi:hypothetical protein
MFAWLKSHFFSLAARANVFAGPPDFGPDRRPFLSLADELQDRCSGEAERNAALSQKDREAWVRDLFERVYETVSLFNLDRFQRARSITLRGQRLRRKPIPGDEVTLPRDGAMTNRHALRNDAYTVLAYVFFAIILLHVAAALFHALIRRDGVFRAMAGIGPREPVTLGRRT